jgi:ankyrin repeat protein
MVGTLAAAGADLYARAVRMWHRETLLYWACSNHDVALVDALLGAGADIEHAGSSINDGSPLSSAVGCGLDRGQGAARRRTRRMFEPCAAVKIRLCPDRSK